MSTPVDPLKIQHGGSHYKNLPIQPVEFGEANGLSMCQSSAVKYLTRYKSKDGRKDLLKARHFVELLKKLVFVDRIHPPAALMRIGTAFPITPELYCEKNRVGHKERAAIILVCRFSCEVHLDEAIFAIDELLAVTPDTPDYRDTVINVQQQVIYVAKNRLEDVVKTLAAYQTYPSLGPIAHNELTGSTRATLKAIEKLNGGIAQLIDGVSR